jgi:hypothetical protein
MQALLRSQHGNNSQNKVFLVSMASSRPLCNSAKASHIKSVVANVDPLGADSRILDQMTFKKFAVHDDTVSPSECK